MVHFVSLPREKEKREDIVEEMKEREKGRMRKKSESEEIEEIRNSPSYHYLLQR